MKIERIVKSDSKWKIRLYNNTIDLNKIIIKDAGSLPNFYIIFDKLEEAVIYIIIDMIVEYWQIRVKKENVFKIIFVTVWNNMNIWGYLSNSVMH